MIQHIPCPAGRLEALVDDPASLCTTGAPRVGNLAIDVPAMEPPVAGVVLAHPHPLYGGTMHNRVVYQAAKAFCRLRCAVLRFNFRGVGVSDGTFADGVGEMDDFRAALDYMERRYPGVPLWAAGVSFGSWVGMTAGALDDRVTELLGVALPSPMFDFSTVRDSTKPKYFIHGEHDEICPVRGVKELYARAAEPKEIVIIDAADHMFDGRVSEVAATIEDLMAR